MRKLFKIGNSLNTFLTFFLLMSFVASCFGMLFVNVLRSEYDLILDAEHMEFLGKMGFLNVLLFSIAAAIIDRHRRVVSVDKPAKRILEATQRITAGDLNVEIEPIGAKLDIYSFDAIIHNLNKMTRELESIETFRTDFIANVSHELKTPLAVMGNYATMLQKPGISEEDRIEYAKAISHSTRRLAALITNILKLNKLENQQIFPQPREFNLGEQLCESLLTFEDAWEKKNLEIETNIQEDVHVRSDPELLSLVWNNLISNAVKFTPEGGTIGVILKADEQNVLVSVRDTGCGIDPETGKHIFEKFYQGDTSHATQGNGLGLALVKRVVDILRVEISVQSTPNRGSTFTVRIRRNGS